MKRSLGFTLVEIIVTVSILSILAAVMIANVAESGRQSRDIERKGDIRTLQSALELYRQRYDRYPAGCNGGGAGWSGQIGTAYQCANGNGQYIVGLAPEFIPILPTDPRLNGQYSGYVYRTNSNGTVYKLVALNTVEAEVVASGHPFQFCDADNQRGDANKYLCINTTTNGGAGGTPSHCDQGQPLFKASYGVWGGFAKGTSDAQAMLDTEEITCSVPPTS